MPLEVKSLASGSSGNAFLVTYRDKNCSIALLIDAGLPVRSLVKYIQESGFKPGDLSGIVLTHEHFDHSKSAYAFSNKFDVPIVANRKTLNRIFNGKEETFHADLSPGVHWCDGPLCVETFRVSHDATDPVGVNVYCRSGRYQQHKVSIVVDLGSIDDTVRQAIAGADLLVVEANHDVYRLSNGPYPGPLKSRILSEHGHLSNETAVDLMAEHLRDKGPCAFWLAHLSKVNNLPKLALNYANATLKMRTTCPYSLDVALRDKPSATWSPGTTPLQLGLF